jgi:hypothetical protein
MTATLARVQEYLRSRRRPAPAPPTARFVEVRCDARFVTYAVRDAAGVPLRLIDFAPPSSAPGVEVSLLYGPLPDPTDPHAEAAIVANLEDMGMTVLAHRPTLL